MAFDTKGLREFSSENVQKVFRLKTKKLLLTYKTHIDMEKFNIEFLKKITTDKKIQFVAVWSHETGHSTGVEYKHTHIYLELNKILETTSARFFDFEGIHPNIESRIKNVEKCINYVLKEHKEESSHKFDMLEAYKLATDEWRNESFENQMEDQAEKWRARVKLVQECKTEAEALSLTKGPSEVLAFSNIWKARPKTLPDIKVELLFTWQWEFLKEFSEKPKGKNIRNINWFYDPEGDTGKTLLCRYLTLSKSKDWAIITCSMSMSNLANLIKKELESGWTGLGVIFDLPRDVAELDYIYSGLENICNGMMTNTKYQAESLVFENPNVCVFSNDLPLYKKLSLDRWKMRRLKKYTNKETQIENVIAVGFKPCTDVGSEKD